MKELMLQKYCQTRDPETRNNLIQEYLPLVRQLAGRMAYALPPQVDADDLVASGVIGLMEALDRFNPELETSFKTFATWRVRGAMLDELRRLSWAPRSLFTRLRGLQAAEEKLGHKLGREPSIMELAKELEWATEEVEQVYSQINCQSLISLESLLFTPAAAAAEQDDEYFSCQSSHLSPPAQLERKEQQEVIAKAIAELPEREKLILALYYKEELTLKEIGTVLKVSTPRVSQLHARALCRIREKIMKAGHLEL